MKHLLFFVILNLSQLPIQFHAGANISGFSIDLIHRYSQMSPFYNHSTTPTEHAINYAQRSLDRSNHFRSSSINDGSKVESKITEGDYLMSLSVGNPPIEALVIVDTGSDLLWLQCEPCFWCYIQGFPLFNPSQSSTYMTLPCSSKPCQAMQSSRCGATNDCEFYNDYGNGLFNYGLLASDTVTFDTTDGKVIAFPNSVFGCVHYHIDGDYYTKYSGVVGLGAGPLSLVSQFGDQIQHKFSYCLLPSSYGAPSKLKFGADADLYGPQVVSTPLLFKSSNSNNSTFYYLNLEAVSVGDHKIENRQTGKDEGNIIIDSGTSLNIMETSFYNEIEDAIKKTVGLQPVQGPSGFKLCYNSKVPDLTMVFHFTGADVTLNKLSTFKNIDVFTCLGMVPRDGVSIYGNWAQLNFAVAYDLAKKQVSFAPTDCTKY